MSHAGGLFSPWPSQSGFTSHLAGYRQEAEALTMGRHLLPSFTGVQQTVGYRSRHQPRDS